MSSTDPTVPLSALRNQIDCIDDQLHILLQKRAAVVQQVAATKQTNDGPAYRPGREAQIIRRLLHQHEGGLPRQTLVRIWRELLAGTTAMQGRFAVAVFEPDGRNDLSQLAREHFGALTPLHAYTSGPQVMQAITRNADPAAVAVLPLPSDADDQRTAWWTALLQRNERRVHVVGRLPFWGPRPEGAPSAQALVIAVTPPDPSGADRSLLGLEVRADVSQPTLATALKDVGLAPEKMILRRNPGTPIAHVLVEIAGFLRDDDERLQRLGEVLHPPVVLGAYAIPETGAAA